MGLSDLLLDYMRNEHLHHPGGVSAKVDVKTSNGRKIIRVRYSLEGHKYQMFYADPMAVQKLREMTSTYEEAQRDVASWAKTFPARLLKTKPNPNTMRPSKSPSTINRKVKLSAPRRRRIPSTKKQAKICQDLTTNQRDRTYFHDSHADNLTLFVNSVSVISKADRPTEIVYMVNSDRKSMRCPRRHSVWLDGMPLKFILNEINTWKERVNGRDMSFEPYLPPHFSRIEATFMRWNEKRRPNGVSSAYLAGNTSKLKNLIFPFFRRLNVLEPRWPDYYHQLLEHLEDSLNTNETRNGYITAMNSWLKFGSSQNSEGHQLWKLLPVMRSLPVSSKHKNPIPMDYFPRADDVLKAILLMPPSKCRFALLMIIGFGMRMSEAFATTPEDIIDQNEIEIQAKGIVETEKYIDKYRDAKGGQSHPVLFCRVQRTLRDVDVRVQAMMRNVERSDPKAGAYTAVCVHQATAEAIILSIEQNEHEMEVALPKRARKSNSKTKKGTHSYYKIFTKTDLGDLKDMRYGHYRKWHVTFLRMASWGKDDAADAHGHSVAVSDMIYNQVALIQKRSPTPVKRVIKLIS